ncbi:hypothetical protein [Photorhabdus caribbeanensis]|uniref:hypothetical protein n=1 Tax=Photorhabdus caribbeanensis TaxID=1004165 RepID=UPI001BD2F500|nr:hypothetical protein [Photorhabdus caribbeanensis]MBS9422756.1 hypothetical protein [Photorhabdus caribbeanensis]
MEEGLAGSALAFWCSKLPLKILLLEATTPGVREATVQRHCFSDKRIALWEPLGGYVNPRLYSLGSP